MKSDGDDQNKMQTLRKRRSSEKRKESNGNTKLKMQELWEMCFQESYLNNGAKPETKRMIINMSVNGSGIRDISRVLRISKNTVMKT